MSEADASGRPRGAWRRLAALAAPLVLAACVPMPYLRAPAVSGRVVDAATGAPLAGAVVVVRWDARYDELLPDRDLVGYREAISDASGAFRIDAWLSPGLSAWPLVRTEAHVVGAIREGYRCPVPQRVPVSGVVALALPPALSPAERRDSCRPVSPRESDAPHYAAAWRSLYPPAQSAKEREAERELERVLQARSRFGFGDNCEGPVDDLALAPGGKRAAYLTRQKGVSRVAVVELSSPARHVARLRVEDVGFEQLAWSGPSELVLWSPATELDRAVSPSVFSSAPPRVVWRADAAPAAPLPSPDPGPVHDAAPRRPFDPASLHDEGDARWLGRSFALRRVLDPDTGLARDLLRIDETSGTSHEIALPGEACGPHGRFGRPHYRIAFDGRTALDLRHVRGGCHAVAIDLVSGDWGMLDDARGRSVCQEARAVPAGELETALGAYMLDVGDALAAAGADRSATYSLRIGAHGATEAVSRDAEGRPVRASVPDFPLTTPLHRIDVSVVGAEPDANTPPPLRGIEPL